jgi:hypothetical protein
VDKRPCAFTCYSPASDMTLQNLRIFCCGTLRWLHHLQARADMGVTYKEITPELQSWIRVSRLSLLHAL